MLSFHIYNYLTIADFVIKISANTCGEKTIAPSRAYIYTVSVKKHVEPSPTNRQDGQDLAMTYWLIWRESKRGTGSDVSGDASFEAVANPIDITGSSVVKGTGLKGTR